MLKVSSVIAVEDCFGTYLVSLESYLVSLLDDVEYASIRTGV